MELTQPSAAGIAADCLPQLATALTFRRFAGIRWPIELCLLAALVAEVAGWAADEWADRRAVVARRGRRGGPW